MSENFNELNTTDQNQSEPNAYPASAQAEQVNRWIRAAIGGEVEAFGHLYELYFDSIYRYCAYRVAVKSEAEDLTAEVFLKAWQAIGRYQPSAAPFLAWLYRIAHNQVIDRRRGRYQQNEAADAGLDPRFLENIRDESLISDPLKNTLLKSQHRTLYQAMTTLPADQQQVLYLRFIEGWNHRQIAVALGKNENTVRGLQFRALATLGKLLSKETFVGE